MFDFPTGLKNCMQMVKVGGHYLGVSSPTNNYMGHGFYQFSPEVYFQALSPENGFQIENILLHEGRETKKWFKVSRPADVNRRVGLENYTPTDLLILATKLTERQIFRTPPQQSDYVSDWASPDAAPRVVGGRMRKLAKRWIPPALKRRIKSVLRNFGASQLFVPFDPHASPDVPAEREHRSEK